MPEYFYFIDGGGEKGEVLGIKKNYSGYFKTGLVMTREQVNDKNWAMGLTKGDEYAMMYCSMTGMWDKYDEVYRKVLDDLLKKDSIK